MMHLCEDCFPHKGPSDSDQAMAAFNLFREEFPEEPEGPKQ